MSVISNNSITDANSVNLQSKERINPLVEKQATENLNVDKAIAQETVNVEKGTQTKVSAEQLEMVAQQLQSFVGEMNKGLEFLVDKDSGRDVIKVIDKNSGDLIKQYPSEEVLSLVSRLSDAAGGLVNEKI